jgi:hypothetical protein
MEADIDSPLGAHFADTVHIQCVDLRCPHLEATGKRRYPRGVGNTHRGRRLCGVSTLHGAKLTVAIDCGPFVLAGAGWYRPGRGERAALVLDTIMERQSVERARVLHPACDLLCARSTQLFAQPRDVRDAAVLNGEHRIQKYGVATVCVSHHSCCLVPRSRTTACQQAWRLASVVLQSPEIRRVKDPDYATRGIPSGTSPVTVP